MLDFALMEQRALEDVFAGLNGAGVRYLVVGGLAVVAHGYARLTLDVDVVLDLSPKNVRKTIQVLKRLEYQPRAPVPFEDFADVEKRQQWSDEKHMRVFSVWSPKYPLTEVDLFLAVPFEDFEAAYARGIQRELAPSVVVQFVGREDLLAMKREAGRPKDVEDIRVLVALNDEEWPQ